MKIKIFMLDLEGIKYYEHAGHLHLEGEPSEFLSACKRQIIGRPVEDRIIQELRAQGFSEHEAGQFTITESGMQENEQLRKNLPRDRASYTKWVREYERRKAQAVASSNAEQRRRGMIGNLEHGHEHTKSNAKHEAHEAPTENAGQYEYTGAQDSPEDNGEIEFLALIEDYDVLRVFR